MFLIKLAFLVLIVFGVNVVVKLILRKVLKLEKEKKEFFSYNYFNDSHRKIDWGIRITAVITIIATNIMVVFENYPNYFLLIPIFFIGLEFLVKVFFERKYSQNPKQYILTLSEGVLMFLTIAIFILLNLNLFF